MKKNYYFQRIVDIITIYCIATNSRKGLRKFIQNYLSRVMTATNLINDRQFQSIKMAYYHKDSFKY
jgi:hypothetical protein